MAATRYRKFLRLAENWPIDPTKAGRDFGVHLRQAIAAAFREGPNTKINEKDCDRQYEALQRLNTDHNRKKFPRVKETSATGSTAEECNMVMATATMQEMEYLDKNIFQKVKSFFTSDDDLKR
ncbi:ubiquinol-cytochrome-c reductase complex assembly factor 2-like [Apostichopus japonicus]|uniref:ubiquinol-cytochrome-c reductase complex assembly factor 2-like n=1 Tax=Stichopus japonicus TaxID=307972 RepID=UPI003AB49CF3